LVFVKGFDGDEIHATFAAIISGVEPVPFGVSELGIVAQPGKPVKMVAITFIAHTIHSWN